MAALRELFCSADLLRHNFESNILKIFNSDWKSLDNLQSRLEFVLGMGYELDIMEIGISTVQADFVITKYIGETFEESTDITGLVEVPSRNLTILLDIRLQSVNIHEDFEENNPFGLNFLEFDHFEE